MVKTNILFLNHGIDNKMFDEPILGKILFKLKIFIRF